MECSVGRAAATYMYTRVYCIMLLLAAVQELMTSLLVARYISFYLCFPLSLPYGYKIYSFVETTKQSVRHAMTEIYGMGMDAIQFAV